MASFDDINAYINSARQAQEHLESYKNDIVASKVGDIKERYEDAINKIGQFGQATVGASTAFHLGRKIYKKGKEKYGKDPAKKKSADESKEDEFDDDPSTTYKNPAFDPESLNEGQNENPEPVRVKPEEGEGEEPESDPISGGDAKPITQEDVPEGAGGGASESTELQNLGSRGGLTEEQAKQFTQANDVSESTIDDVSNNVSGAIDDAANVAKRTISSTLDGSGDAAAGALDIIKQGAKRMISSAGEKIGEQIGFDVAGAALDALPVVGEISGVAQIFAGLFKDHKERAKEQKEETTAQEQIRSQGTIAIGGIDTSINQGVATVAGLV